MVKLRLYFNIPREGIFIPSNYKVYLSQRFTETYMENVSVNPCFVFSDLVPIAKKEVGDDSREGEFWALKRAAMDISFIDESSAVKMVLALTKYKCLELTFGSLIISQFKLLPYKCSKTGYILSPVVCRKDNRSIDYINFPAEFNESIRQNLIEKYKNLFGTYPNDDRFILIIRNPKKIIFADESFGYKGPFEIVGSDELLKLAYGVGIGNDNTQGYGMISSELYFWKRQKAKS